MTMSTKLTTKDRADKFAKRANVALLGELFGEFFAFHNREKRAFQVGRINPAAKGKVTVYAKEFPRADDAINEARVRGAGEPVVSGARVPMQELVNKFCQETGMRASDAAFGDFVVVSRPLTDKQRDWRIARRKGNRLELVRGQQMKDRWAARGKALRLAGDAPWESLTGACMFPFGNHFAMPPKSKQQLAAEAVKEAEEKKSETPEKVSA